jgi:hypothetical protein
MVILKNVEYKRFLVESEGKNIVIFGNGANFEMFCCRASINSDLLDRVVAVVDNNKDLIGKKKQSFDLNYTVQSVDELVESDIDIKNCVVIITISSKYLLEICEQLDKIEIFNDVYCYCIDTALNWWEEHFPVPVNSEMPKPKRKHNIPKILHYFWFGGNPIPEKDLECIESWKKYCPDYEIKLWNEDNYDISKTPQYIKDAYKAKKWGFVPDFPRLDVIYNYGGIYLDTDVEIMKNIDFLLEYGAFCGYTNFDRINFGQGFGAEKGNSFIKESMELYENAVFKTSDNCFNMVDCTWYTNYLIAKKGMKLDGNFQLFDDDVIVFPRDYFCPLSQDNFLYQFTENTVSIHTFNVSYMDGSVKNYFDEFKKLNSSINERLLNDWRKEFGQA